MSPRFLLAALAGAVAELCAVGLTATAAWLIARAAEQPPIAALGLAIVAVRAFALFRGVFRYAERLAGHDVALRAVARLRSRVYAALVRRQDAALRDGDALSRMVSDVDSVQDLLVRCLLPAGVAVAAGAVAVAVCSFLVPTAGALLAAGLVFAGVLLPALAMAWVGRMSTRLAQLRAELTVRSLDLVDGQRDLEAFGATGRAIAKASQAAENLARWERTAACVGTVISGIGMLVQGLTAVLVMTAAVRSGADSVLIAVLVLTTLAAFEPVLPLGEAAQRFVELRPAARRVAELLAPSPIFSHVRHHSSVEIRGVHVTFAGKAALDDVSLLIDPGRTLAIVGASGAGKSTLLAVMSGVVRPDAGSVRAPASRALTQGAHVFRTSIRANLALARPEATDTEIWEAVRLSGATSWLESLPEGLDTVVGEDGRQISGGQRQRLLLARAVLADPELLLLDEPTEGLDTVAADDVLAGILAARAGRTTVVVTHRLAGLSDVDEVAVVDRGRIVQRGPHSALVSRPGPYRDLWAAELLVS